MNASIQRRLAAVLAADMVGYSASMQRDETGTIRRFKAVVAELFETHLEQFGGRIFKKLGDGLLIEFASAVAAVEYAIAVQTSLAERNAKLPENERTTFRMGVNLGDIVIDGEDILGDGVNVAARLENIAQPGGVVVSDIVYRNVLGKIEVRFTDMGPQNLKNIAKAIQAFAAVLDDADVTEDADEKAATPPAGTQKAAATTPGDQGKAAKPRPGPQGEKKVPVGIIAAVVGAFVAVALGLTLWPGSDTGTPTTRDISGEARDTIETRAPDEIIEAENNATDGDTPSERVAATAPTTEVATLAPETSTRERAAATGTEVAAQTPDVATPETAAGDVAASDTTPSETGDAANSGTTEPTTSSGTQEVAATEPATTEAQTSAPVGNETASQTVAATEPETTDTPSATGAPDETGGEGSSVGGVPATDESENQGAPTTETATLATAEPCRRSHGSLMMRIGPDPENDTDYNDNTAPCPGGPLSVATSKTGPWLPLFSSGDQPFVAKDMQMTQTPRGRAIILQDPDNQLLLIYGTIPKTIAPDSRRVQIAKRTDGSPLKVEKILRVGLEGNVSWAAPTVVEVTTETGETCKASTDETGTLIWSRWRCRSGS